MIDTFLVWAMLHASMPAIDDTTALLAAEDVAWELEQLEVAGLPVPTVPVVVSVIRIESVGAERACKQTTKGAARGLMQIYRSGATCRGGSPLYAVATNVHVGIGILSDCMRRMPRSYLECYSGHKPVQGRSFYSRFVTGEAAWLTTTFGDARVQVPYDPDRFFP